MGRNYKTNRPRRKNKECNIKPLIENRVFKKNLNTQKAAELLLFLEKTFPRTFFYSNPIKATLAINIAKELDAVMKHFPEKEMLYKENKALMFVLYTRSLSYKKALARRLPRVNLSGTITSHVDYKVSQEAKEYLKNYKLERFKKLVKTKIDQRVRESKKSGKDFNVARYVSNFTCVLRGEAPVFNTLKEFKEWREKQCTV